MISGIIATAEEKMAKAVESAKEDFAGVRTGRANPQLFQKVMVDYYGTPTPLGQLGQLANPEARTIVITPYDKGALKAIEAAFTASALIGPLTNWSMSSFGILGSATTRFFLLVLFGIHAPSC